MNRLSLLFALLALAPCARAVQPDVSGWARQQNEQSQRAVFEARVEAERLIESHRRSSTLRYVRFETFVRGGAPTVEYGPMHIDEREIDAHRASRLDPLRRLPPLQRVIAHSLLPSRVVGRLQPIRQPVRDGSEWRYDFAFPRADRERELASTDSLSLWFAGRGEARLVRSRARLNPPRASEPLIVEATYARHKGLDVVESRRVWGVFVVERRGRGFSYRIAETQNVRFGSGAAR